MIIKYLFTKKIHEPNEMVKEANREIRNDAMEMLKQIINFTTFSSAGISMQNTPLMIYSNQSKKLCLDWTWTFFRREVYAAHDFLFA